MASKDPTAPRRAILPVRAKVRDQTGSGGYGEVRDEPLTEGDGERVDGLVMLV